MCKELGAVSMTGEYVSRGAESAASDRVGGKTKIIDPKVFANVPMARPMIGLEPGGMREVHSHPDADEIQHCLGGNAPTTAFKAARRSIEKATRSMGTSILLAGPSS